MLSLAPPNLEIQRVHSQQFGKVHLREALLDVVGSLWPTPTQGYFCLLLAMGSLAFCMYAAAQRNNPRALAPGSLEKKKERKGKVRSCGIRQHVPGAPSFLIAHPLATFLKRHHTQLHLAWSDLTGSSHVLLKNLLAASTFRKCMAATHTKFITLCFFSLPVLLLLPSSFCLLEMRHECHTSHFGKLCNTGLGLHSQSCHLIKPRGFRKQPTHSANWCEEGLLSSWEVGGCLSDMLSGHLAYLEMSPSCFEPRRAGSTWPHLFAWHPQVKSVAALRSRPCGLHEGCCSLVDGSHLISSGICVLSTMA